jgi:hypothetical protein
MLTKYMWHEAENDMSENKSHVTSLYFIAPLNILYLLSDFKVTCFKSYIYRIAIEQPNRLRLHAIGIRIVCVLYWKSM